MPRKPSAHFDTLLRVRRRQEDLRARALAGARREIQRAEQELEGLETTQRETLQEAGQRARKRFDALEVRLYYQYERYVARLADEKSVEVTELRGVAEQRRAELEEAMKRRRIMEKLIEKKKRTYAAEARKDEQAFADETAVNHAAMARAVLRGVKRAGMASMPEPAEAEIEQVL